MLPFVIMKKIWYIIKMDFSHLNEKQQEAVHATEGALLILAGAGSGKTTVLMNRIANLLVNKGVDPYEIIAITFTNKAAGEMKNRLERMNIPGATDVWASTFHSACAKILRRDIDKLGYDRSFTIYDTADCVSLMKRILKEQEIDEKLLAHRTVLNYISRAKDEMITAADFLGLARKDGDPRKIMIGQAYAEYEKRLQGSNALDFDDLLLMTVMLLYNQPEIMKYYRQRFKYVMVDEYQDTNNLQYKLTSALAGGYGNICVVGDDDQSIYKFRGATIENILSFENQYKDTKVIRLEQNYRSTGAILDAANDVIKCNKHRKGKKLWTQNNTGDKPVLHIVNNERKEAEFVADEIIKSNKEGQNWQEHVILYRMNAQSNQFETAFKRRGIPYRIFGGTGFYERAEIKDMLAYLCVIHNPTDDVRLLRIINNPARGLGDTTIQKLVAIAGELGISVFEAIFEAHKYENVKAAAPKLKKFAQIIGELQEIAENSQLDVLYDELLSRTGYIRVLEEKQSDENISRIENVKELKTNIIAFMNENDGSLFDFLSETALYTDLDRDDNSTDRVLMMTMHSAKGLEFDTVFIAGAEEGIFPGVRTIGYPEEMEEERRLCYVAMTRAIRKLHFISAKQRMIFGKTSTVSPSRFISEIKEDSLEINDITDDFSYEPARFTPTVRTAAAPVKRPAPITYTAPVREKFNTGDKVEHNSFGHGTIKSVTQAGGDALLMIDFKEHGIKRLMQNTASKYMKKV